MKFFKIYFQNFYDIGRVPSYAIGDEIPNAEFYFNKISQGEILFSAPIFDCFFLESFDKKEFWEWKLCDVHGFTKEAGRINGWLISEKLKLLLENYNLPKPYHFYPSKLLYKEEKLDYYVFQFAGQSTINSMRIKYINWEESIFFNPIDESYSSINSMQEFIDESRHIMKTSKYNKEISLRKLVLHESLDFFPMATYLKDDIVSESLKKAIEKNEIEGFEFSELDYEVVVNE
jgi:hypothetical protein